MQWWDQVDTTEALAHGRTSYTQRAWRDAYGALCAADEHEPLDAEDLHRLGMAAYLIGRDDDAVEGLQRAHHAFLDDGEVARAVRCAFWIGLTLFLRGREAEGGGWLGRAQHALGNDTQSPLVERGYLLIPAALHQLNAGNPVAAHATCVEVAGIAEGGDAPDLVALSMLGQGQALIAMGETTRGVAALDEAMAAVTTGAVSPIAAGMVYCALIIVCRQIYDLRRAQEWTSVLSRWCEDQQDLHPYRGQCLVHRSQIMQLRGQWSEAIDEAQRACAHLADPPGDPVLGMAHYQLGELLRLRGKFDQGEQAYRRAAEAGHPVQPGLALLRLAEGRVDDATAAIRRVAADTENDTMRRSQVLAAYVEIVLAAGDVDAARTKANELMEIAADIDAPYLRAVATSALGAVQLADGDPRAASDSLGAACASWHELGAPYEAARVRLLMARAWMQLNDHDTAKMERDAARRVFEQLGAVPALAMADELADSPRPSAPAGLTPREVHVLRLVATGATNRDVADQLVISEKTVARHLSNIFTKLGVTSRAAATAYAFRHHLA